MRQMHTEHHIDSFDLNSFFALHDLNTDGQWDEAEIQAVYGLHHHSVKGKMPPDHVDSRADVVVKKVLEKLDKDKNGMSGQAVRPSLSRLQPAGRLVTRPEGLEVEDWYLSLC